MLIFPAIDVLDGKCVRLERGDYEKSRVYVEDPAHCMEEFAQLGYRHAHVVDLDAARRADATAGMSSGVKRALSVGRERAMQVQAGGGIRGVKEVEAALEAGAWRVVMGTAALEDEGRALYEASREFEGKVCAALDAREGKAWGRGWRREGVGERGVLEWGRRFEELGAAAVVYTSIERDGMELGADVEGTRALAGVLGVGVVASGGVAGIGDVEALGGVAGVEGVIVGRALYEGKISARELLEAKGC